MDSIVESMLNITRLAWALAATVAAAPPGH